MTNELFELWTYLAARPLTGLTITLLAYYAATTLHQRLGSPSILNPVLLSIALIGSLLFATETPYATYFEGAQFVHFLLGPATVALAVPLYAHLSHVRASLRSVALGVVGGGISASLIAMGLAAASGADREIIVTVAPKSVTTPVAMALTELSGGLPSLTAVLVILTALVGTVGGAPILDRLGIRNPSCRGLAYGVTAHGLGTARAFTESPLTGSFASLGMGLNALLTSVWLPPLLRALRLFG